jgi:predicted metal-dependent hydrolase
MGRMNTQRIQVDNVPRHMGFDFPTDTPKYWFGNDPWATHLLNALSLTFPAGEAEFVRSVRAVKDRLTDPELLEDVRAFSAQEMHHSKEHVAFNEWLRSLGLPVDSIYSQIEGIIAAARGDNPVEVNLAITAALEHFTAILADALMTSSMADEMHENVKWLWLWHAIEETEHKAVAFDAYQAIGGTYPVRVLVMAQVTARFLLNSLRFQIELVRADGQLTNVRGMAGFLWRFFGPRGHLTAILPAYLDYYRPNFHPWQQDNRSTVARLKAEVEARAKRIFESSRRRDPSSTAA